MRVRNLIRILSVFVLVGFFGCVHGKKPEPTPVPAPVPAPLPAPEIYDVAVVHFAFDSAKLDKSQRDEINKVFFGKSLNLPVTVIGYTDSQGSVKYNLKLSKKRARAVVKYLKKLKVKGKITVVGKGESNLLNADKTEPEHKLNRRAEITLLLK